MKTNISDKNQRNQLNATLWQQPWYQQWFASKGIDKGGKVKLSDQERKELQALVVQNGFLDPSDGHIDPAGNVSDFHGWKGLPTAAKIAIMAGAAAGTMGAAGAFGGGAPISASMGGASSTIAPSTGIAGLNTATLASIPGVTTGVGAGVGTAALPTLTGSLIGTGMGTAPSLAGSTAAGLGSASGGALAKGGNIMSRLLGGNTTETLGKAGELLGSFANDEAGNRMNNNNLRSQFEQNRAYLTQNHDNIQLNAAANRRNDETDAIKKLNQTAYIRSGGAPFDASKVQLSGGRSLPNFSFPRPPMSDELKAGATSLESTLLDRLKNGSYNPADLNSYLPSDPSTNGAMNRGVGEQIGRIGSLATTGLGFINNYFGK